MAVHGVPEVVDVLQSWHHFFLYYDIYGSEYGSNINIVKCHHMNHRKKL